MKKNSGLVYALFSTLLGFAYANSNDGFNPSNYASDAVITRDVAVIGGGSSGTYGAINLKLQGQSVVLVEKAGALGGQVHTFHNKTTGATVDYGVGIFWNISVVRDFFAHFNVPLVAPSGHESAHYYDFRTGKPVSVTTSLNFTPYAEQLNKYPYLEYSWNLPNPIPADLLLPFGDFIKKYNLQSLAFNIYFYAQGVTNFLSQLTVEVFKAVDQSFLGILQGHGLVTAAHNNQQVFQLAQAELGSNALVNSVVVAAQRPENNTGVRLQVQTPSGKKLIIASKLLISIPPLLSNMAPFDLDSTENQLFSQWTYSAYYTMLVNNTGLAFAGSYVNAVSDPSTYNIPALPAAYQITATAIEGLYYVWYAGPNALAEDIIKANVTSVIQKLRAGENSTSNVIPDFVAFRSHTPFKLEVSASALQNGFYKNLDALQGCRSTWYTGAAFLSSSSAELWNFTAALIPEIIAA